MATLCRPQGFSWLDAHAVVTEDKRDINPGMLDVPLTNMGMGSVSGHGHTHTRTSGGDTS
jgi:hypothetical protein